jgi:hypothetical protein
VYGGHSGGGEFAARAGIGRRTNRALVDPIGADSRNTRFQAAWLAYLTAGARPSAVSPVVQNLVVAGRGWAFRIEQFPEMAAELVKAKVDVIVCAGDAALRAAQQATMTIPIIGITDDMVGSGLVHSLARPDGNTTGVSILASELDVKRLEILHELIPRAKRIAVLADPTTISTGAQLASAARDLGVELVSFEARSPDEVGRALDAVAGANVGAVAPNPSRPHRLGRPFRALLKSGRPFPARGRPSTRRKATHVQKCP